MYPDTRLTVDLVGHVPLLQPRLRILYDRAVVLWNCLDISYLYEDILKRFYLTWNSRLSRENLVSNFRKELLSLNFINIK